jgi:hypothetical protein
MLVEPGSQRLSPHGFSLIHRPSIGPGDHTRQGLTAAVKCHQAVKRSADTQPGALARVNAGPVQRISNRNYGRPQELPGILLLPAIVNVAADIFTDPEAEDICVFIDHDAFATARSQVDSKKPG